MQIETVLPLVADATWRERLNALHHMLVRDGASLDTALGPVGREVLAAGAPVVVVGNRREVWVKVFVPENMVSRVEMGAPATLHFDGLDREFGGHVIFVSPQAEFTPRNVQTAEERVTQTFAVKVALDEVENYLRPGVAADVTLKLRERA